MTKTLRVRERAGWITKPIENRPENRLSAEEIDDNFLAISDEITQIQTTIVQIENSVGDVSGEIDQKIVEHTNSPDPHDQYLTQQRGDALYKLPDYVGNIGKGLVVNNTGDGVEWGSVATDNNTMTLRNKSIVSPIVSGTSRNEIVPMNSSTEVDCSVGSCFIRTVNGNVAFSFSNAPTGHLYGFILKITHVSGTITWPASVYWPSGIAPTLNTGKTHQFLFMTTNGGVSWQGMAAVDYGA